MAGNAINDKVGETSSMLDWSAVKETGTDARLKAATANSAQETTNKEAEDKIEFSSDARNRAAYGQTSSSPDSGAVQAYREAAKRIQKNMLLEIADKNAARENDQ